MEKSEWPERRTYDHLNADTNLQQAHAEWQGTWLRDALSPMVMPLCMMAATAAIAWSLSVDNNPAKPPAAAQETVR